MFKKKKKRRRRFMESKKGTGQDRYIQSSLISPRACDCLFKQPVKSRCCSTHVGVLRFMAELWA